MQQHYDHIIADISEIKPTIKDGAIYFPLKLETGHVEEDGLSLGLPVDCGPYSIVTFERAVGVLAEDTAAMFLTYQEREKSSAKPLHIDNYAEFKNWKTTPAYQKWLADFPETEICKECFDFCERMEEEYKGCDNYWHWSPEKRKSLDDLQKVDFTQVKDENILVDLSSKQWGRQLIYKTEKGDYIAYHSGHRYAELPEYYYCDLLVTEQELLDIVDAKKQIREQNQELLKKANENMKVLSTIFGYTAT